MASAAPPALHAAIRARARLFDIPHQAVIATTVGGVIVHWSEGAEQVYGWAADEVLGRNVVDVTPTRMSREQAAAVLESLAAGRSWTGRFAVRRRDGVEFTADVRDLPVHDARGELVGIIGISTPAQG